MNSTEPPLRGFGNDSLRRDNLATILRIVHRRGSRGLSRSELTSLTGMNRSTIAGLVGELVERRLVSETEPMARNGVGRPSPIVITAQNAAVLAVNPEIDAIEVAIVSLGGRIMSRARVAASADLTVVDTVELATNAARSLMRGLTPTTEIIGIGIAIPGLVRASDGVVRLAPHFEWAEAPLTQLLSEALGIPAVAANDASLGALAEGAFGAGRGIDDLLYLNGGASGIGGGIVSGGRPLVGSAGYAGELGHTLVRTDGILCHCGATGCLETEVRRAPLLSLVGLSDENSDQLGEALKSSLSESVQAEVSRQLGFLGIALRNAINTFNPRRIVLGGFLAALYASAPEGLGTSIAARPLAPSAETVDILPAELGSDILMVGAAELAFAGLLANPTMFT